MKIPKHIKVKDLIEFLRMQDSEKYVYLSRDPEGNSFLPLYENCISQSNFDIYECEEEGLKPNSIIIYPG